MTNESGHVELSAQDIRVVARHAADSAQEVLPIFEESHPGDRRPRAAIEAARAFAEGARRTKAQRTTALAAHQIALQAERALVKSDGLSYAVYTRFCNRWTARIGARRAYPRPPPDIDLQPEIDEEDRVTLERMRLPRTTIAQQARRRRRRA